MPGPKQPLRVISLGGFTAGKGLGRISQMANSEWQEMPCSASTKSQISS